MTLSRSHHFSTCKLEMIQSPLLLHRAGVKIRGMRWAAKRQGPWSSESARKRNHGELTPSPTGKVKAQTSLAHCAGPQEPLASWSRALTSFPEDFTSTHTPPSPRQQPEPPNAPGGTILASGSAHLPCPSFFSTPDASSPFVVPPALLLLSSGASTYNTAPTQHPWPLPSPSQAGTKLQG